jgi:hypothetical protein
MSEPNTKMNPLMATAAVAVIIFQCGRSRRDDRDNSEL